MTVSKAADRSSKISNEDLEASLASLRASTTESKAVSVKCPLLKPDWLLSRRLFTFMVSLRNKLLIVLLQSHTLRSLSQPCINLKSFAFMHVALMRRRRCRPFLKSQNAFMMHN